MQKAVFIIVFSFWAAGNLPAQNIGETYLFANQQFSLGNYKQALAEYQRVAFFDSENQFEDVFQKIGDSFYALGDFNSAVKNYDIAARFSKNDSIKTELVLKKANSLFQQGNFVFALNELFVIDDLQSKYLQNKFNLYLGIGYFGTGNYSESFNSFSKIVPDFSEQELSLIFKDFEKFRKRFRPSKIQTMSMIFPGLGQMYIGKTGSGINSIILTGGIAVVSIYIWQVYGVLDALLSTGSWYYRYYTGGYKNAEIFAFEKIEHERERVYSEILNLIENNIEKGQ